MTKSLISVLAITNKPKFLPRIYQNYVAQQGVNKELILVLNSSHFSLDSAKKLFAEMSQVSIFQTDDGMSLGENLNFAISQSQGEYLTKLDDDDFYGPLYLKQALQQARTYEADLLGQRSFYVYLEAKNKYYLYERKTPFVLTRVHALSPNIIGPTLFWHQRVSNEVSYRLRHNRVDFFFTKDAIENGFRVVGTFSKQYIRFREADKQSHVDPASDFKKFFIPRCLGMFRSASPPEFLK